MSIATSVDPTFITASADASRNLMTVGNYAPMSSMSPMVQVSEESDDFGVASIFSSIVDQVSSLEYENLCSNVHKAFPDLANLVDSIKSALATTIAEGLQEGLLAFFLEAFLMEIMVTCLSISEPQLWMTTSCLRPHFI